MPVLRMLALQFGHSHLTAFLVVISQAVPYHSNSHWIGQRQAALKLELTKEQKETQEVFRKSRSILNKLTPQNVTELADATCQLKINTEERLRGLVDMIFTRVS